MNNISHFRRTSQFQYRSINTQSALSAYPIDGSEKEFTAYLQRFNLLLIGYLISGITLVGITIYYFKDRVAGIVMWLRRIG